MNSQLRIRFGAIFALAAIALALVSQLATAGSWNANNVSDLIAAINAANRAGGSNSITLAYGRTFILTAVNNTTDGPTALPVIAAGNKLTIQGNGATIARSTAPTTPAFRLFDVASGAALTLQNLTLTNGKIVGDTGTDASGGAILNAAGASLTVKCSTLVSNQVVGGDGAGDIGGLGFGGAVWNDGTACFDTVVFRGNQATGGATTNPDEAMTGPGSAYGGAVHSGNDGNLTVRNCWFAANKAIGGRLHQPSVSIYDGPAQSGAIDNWGAAFISTSTFSDNQAIGGSADEGVDGGYGVGGAIGSGGPMADNPVCAVENCTFRHNLAIGADAGSSNFAGYGVGGAISSGFSQNAAKLTVTGCFFTDNQGIGGSGGFGGGGFCGAINLESGRTPTAASMATIAHCTFVNNQAIGHKAGGVGSGGAIGNADYNFDDGSGASLMISDCRFIGSLAQAAPGGNGDYSTAPGFAFSGAVDTSGSTTILNSTFMNNRAVAGALSPGATVGFYSAALGGGLGSWGGALYIRDSSFVGNQAIGGDSSLGGPASMAMGGGITVFNGLPATIVNCSLINNAAVGGAGGNGSTGGVGVGGALNVGIFPDYGSASGPSSAVTLTGTTISHNQAIGGANGGTGMGGGYAVGTGVLFGLSDTSAVTLKGGSVVKGNQPDDGHQF